MSQLSYAVDQAVAFAGMLADAGMVQDVVTGENLSAAIPFGVMTAIGAGANQIALPAAAGDVTDVKKLVGVAIAHQAMESSASGLPQYAPNSAVNVLKKGRVWVQVENAVTRGTSDVHVRYAGVGQRGGFRGAAVASETAVLPNAKWLSSTTGAGLALLEIDL
jgi:hypothetical protein